MTGPLEAGGLGGRLFLGVTVPDSLAAALRSDLFPALSRLPLRTTPPANLHVTLRFLGSTGAPAAERIDSALRHHPLPLPFEVEAAGYGAFPNPRRASVLWLGFGAGRDRLVTLAGAVAGALAAAGIPAETRPFHPHLTLARARSPLDLSTEIERLPDLAARFSVREVVLFRSHLGAGPPRYEALRRYGAG